MTFKEPMFFLSFSFFFILFAHWLLLIIILSHNQAIAFPTLQYFLLIKNLVMNACLSVLEHVSKLLMRFTDCTVIQFGSYLTFLFF